MLLSLLALRLARHAMPIYIALILDLLSAPKAAEYVQALRAFSCTGHASICLLCSLSGLAVQS